MIAVTIPEMLAARLATHALRSAGIAELVLLASMLMQLSATPYPYAFQNRLEVFLLGCSMLVVVLGVIYAFVAVKSVAVEAALLTVLFGSMGGAVLFIFLKHCREKPGGSGLATRPTPAVLRQPSAERPRRPAARAQGPAAAQEEARSSASGSRRLGQEASSRTSSSCTMHELRRKPARQRLRRRQMVLFGDRPTRWWRRARAAQQGRAAACAAPPHATAHRPAKLGAQPTACGDRVGAMI